MKMMNPLKVVKVYVSVNANNYLLFLHLFCASVFSFGQEKEVHTTDSLKAETYEYLYAQYKSDVADTISSVMYLNAFLDKAIHEKNKINQSTALNNLSYYAKNREDKFDLIRQSLDASNSVDSLLSISTYNNLGLYYQDYYDYKNAIDQFVKVLHLSKKAKDRVYEGIALANIATLKSDAGNHKDALKLYKKCFALKKEDGASTTSISIDLAGSFRYNKEHDSATYYYDLVIDEIKKEAPYYVSLAEINEGVNLYYKGDLEKAKKKLEEGTLLIEDTYLNIRYYLKYYILAQFYLGKIYEHSNTDLAIAYYHKTDSLLVKANIIIPEVREAYKFLKINYAKKSDYSKSLSVINKLLKFDSITSIRKINTTNKLNSEFDTPELLREKEILIQKLKNRNQSLDSKFTYLLLFIFIIIVLLIFQSRRHIIHKKRFHAILNKLDHKIEEPVTVTTLNTIKELNIDPKVVSMVLDKLETFESKKRFLKSTITITSLAGKLSTNTKYLSKIINQYKNKTFITYINDLRIEYILKELQVNPILHRYTILGIAKEIGFNSADSFSAAFKKKTGISPSFYIKKLKSVKKEKITFK